MTEVWSLARSFDQPRKYKPLVSRCIVQGDLKIGSLRQVNVRSGLQATMSTERLERLHDEEQIIGIRIVGGDHWLKVWSLVRSFDQPQKYKPFVSRCIVQGDLRIGSLRQVNVKSGLLATMSTERLERLDDEEHILGIRIVGGDHRLKNYSSIITVHPEITDGRPGTLVIESFVVDVPDGNTNDETCYFVKALINCNLKSLADVSERMAIWGGPTVQV
ncbi:hypothetical protein Vadar_033764 [Vaccinium darrowii]|uniref:Uncharacterized protein n=1 Tax=Vaccinium darrowii TaxID=229202 RepID=A0ACB7YBZ5_9ERIC|nr:hypothetical protein Vadar_033764 [Vaccinium darrowii]